MLDLDLDLEADLGIDTVKQAETFAAIREAWDIPRDDNLAAARLPDPRPRHPVRLRQAARPGAADGHAPAMAAPPAGTGAGCRTGAAPE